MLDLACRAIRVDSTPNGKVLVCEKDNQEIQIPYDQLLIAIGRAPNVTGFGLEDLAIPLNKNNTIETNPFLETNYPQYICSG